MDSKYDTMAMLDRLSNGDFLKQNEVSKESYVWCLEYLSFLAARDQAAAEASEEAIKKSRK